MSLFLTTWFIFPGSQDVAPGISAIIIDLMSQNDINFARLLRPFVILFLFNLMLSALLIKD
tara:strand:+ start:433 stop:615 length:183 start_codon:yes stop_codon:yes gene_type:complete